MPFHSHKRSSSSTNQQHAQQPPFNTSSGIFQAAQALGSIGAPTGNLRSINTGTTTAGTDTLYSNTSSAPTATSESRSRASSSYAPVQSNSGLGAIPSLPSNTPEYSAPSSRASQTYSQQSDELHLGPQPPSNRQHSQGPREYQLGAAPRINLEQASPGNTQSQSHQLPGALQSGGTRGTPSATAQPTKPLLQSNMADPYTASPRSASQSHSYSRSSPSTGAYDSQGFGPFSGSGGQDAAHYASPSSSKYTPQGQQRTVSSTPLGLADIRPRADSSVTDTLPGANPYSYDGANAQPTNSNYLAPWAIYAFDWCKWPAQGHDAGKVAVGSYLEDGHNFVCSMRVNK